MKMFRSILALIFLSGCTAKDPLVPIASQDLVLAQLTVSGGNAFTIQAQTQRQYGCNGVLSVRSGRNSLTIFIDVIGISEGNGSCSGPAVSRPETFERITNRHMFIEIRDRGAADRYKISADGANGWSISSGSGTFSRLSIEQ
jgi:hypothetical protein